MKNIINLSKVIFMISAIIAFTGCKEELTVPVVITVNVAEITSTTALINGAVTDEGGTEIIARGVCCGTSPDCTSADKSASCLHVGFGPFSAEIKDISANTIYYARAWAKNSEGTSYGDPIPFTTKMSLPASLTTTEITSFDQTSATTGGNITHENGATVTLRGVCWDTLPAPTINLATKTSDGEGKGMYTSNMTKLKPSTRYYVRAYATNLAGTGYGNEVIFTTRPITTASITTTQVTSVTCTSAISGGEITNDFGGEVTARGVCWSTSAGPTVSLSTKTTDGEGIGPFTSNLTALNPNTLYFIRAYATNKAGTSYGNELSFTSAELAAPSISTSEISSLTQTSATSGGTILSDNGSPVTASGICWNTSPDPTVLLNTKIAANIGSATFSVNITGLLPGTTYYLRAYATNLTGTAYGNQIIFNTKIADIDANVYATVKIGNQIWMAENLRTTKYSDNTPIPPIPGYSDWIAATTPGYCWYNNDIANKTVYGALYSWLVVDPASNGGKNVCPVGWRVPTETDWVILVGVFGDELKAGEMLKEEGFAHWISPNTGATNGSKFTALPGGSRNSWNGNFDQLGYYAYFWSSSSSEWQAYARELSTNYGTFIRRGRAKLDGCSIRCLRD